MGLRECESNKPGRHEEIWREYTLETYSRLRYSRLPYILFIVAGGFGGYFINVILGSLHSDLSLLEEALVYAKLVWLLYLPIALTAAAGLLLYSPREDFRLERRSQTGDYTVIFQVVTRGFNKDAVKRSVKSILYWAPRYLRRFEVWIVTEDDVDKEFFEGLRRLDDRVRVIYVPRDYRTPRGARYKARALHYAVQIKKRLGLANPKVWVYLMDEESIVGEDTVLGIIDFIEREAPKGRLVGQGLIVYSNYWGRNLLTSFEDSLRAFDDVSRYRLQARLGLVLVGIHGSHLLVRADVEASIGWDFGGVRAEDTVFGLLVNQRYGRVLGWLKGCLYEQSPFTVRDLLRQRRRWAWGVLDLLRLDVVSPLFKAVKLLHLASWLGALPSIIIIISNIVVFTSIPHQALAPIYGFLLATLVYAYLEGYRLNSMPSRTYRLRRMLLLLPLIPLVGLVEAIAPWYALATYHRSKRVGFEVIAK